VSTAVLTARKASLQVAAWLGVLLAALFFGRLLVIMGPTITFAFLSIIAIFLVVMARPAYGALILAAGVPIVSGMTRGFPIPALRPSEAIIALVASAVLLATATRTDRVPWTTFDWLALLYGVGNLMLGSFDLIARGDPFSFDAIGELLGPFQFLLIYRAVMAAVTSEGVRRKAIRLVLFASVPVALLGIAQSLNLGPTRDIVAKLTGIDVSTAYGYQAIPRATGPFPIWHELGGYLFLVILLGLALYLEPDSKVMSRRELGVVLAIAGGGVIATATIAPIAGVVIGALVLGFWMRKLSKLVVGVAIGAMVLALLFSPLLTSRYDQQFGTGTVITHRPDYVPQTLWARYLIWTDQYIPALAKDERWFAGYGPGVPPEVDWPYTESLYITMVLRGGIILLAIYGFLMLALATRARAYTRSRDPTQRALARVVYLSVILLLFMHIVANYFVVSGFPHLFWPLLGLLFARVKPAEGPVRTESGRIVIAETAPAASAAGP
jgi:hypothetical protein